MLPCCAECENSPASLECTHENLAYCSPCSASLHSKKARMHHLIRPLLLCDECETSVAHVRCAECGGRGQPLVFCSRCASDLHSKKARAHHKVESISTLDKESLKKKPNGSRNGGRRLPAEDVGRENEGFASGQTSFKTREGSDFNRQPLKERLPNRGCLHEGNPAIKDREKRLHDDDLLDHHPDLVKKQKWRASPKSSNLGLSKPKKKVESVLDTEEQITRVASRRCSKHACFEESDSSIEILSDDNPRTRQDCGNGLLRRNPKRAALLKPCRSIGNQNLSSSEGSDQLETSSSEDDETYGIRKYHRGSVSFEAFVVDADDHNEGNETAGTCPETHQDKTDVGVQERIRKMLELGLHPDTPDIEAQQALKNAQRLLTKHNLQQAEVMKGVLKNTNALIGGMRMVELRSKGTNQQSGRFEQWVYSLAHLIAVYFDTKYFVRRQLLLQVVFYGIKQNADCAGYAFSATFNRITKLSADYMPSKCSDEQKFHKGCKIKAGRSQNVYTRVSRMSYRNGIVAGLEEAIRTAQMHQKLGRKGEGEEGESKGYTNRGGEVPVGNEDEQSDCCSYDYGCSSAEDFDSCDEEINGNGNVSKGRDADSGHRDDEMSRKRKEQRSAAVSAIIVHSKKVGEEFLKERGIKVRERKMEGPRIWDGEAFVKGKEDSKTIDIGQKGITAKARKPKKSKCT